MYAPVIPKGCPVPATSCQEGLSGSLANTKPEVPAPDRTILKQIDLSGCTLWSPEDCKEATDLLSEFVAVFSHHDLDLREISVVAH